MTAKLLERRIEILGWLRRRLFGISLNETSVKRRGFVVSDSKGRSRIEEIGATFVHGYHAALFTAGVEETLLDALSEASSEQCGFAYEGAAMGLAMLDYTTPWNSGRLKKFLNGIAGDHIYMAHIGAGWAMARIPWGLSLGMPRLDPLLRWLAIDGYGFHEGYFNWQQTINRLAKPKGITGYRARAFDQGLGRSLWFVKGADPDRVADAVKCFTTERHSDLWAGVGLGAAYAGGVNMSELAALRTFAADYRLELAQGAAFAAKARQRAGNYAPHTALACEVFCGIDANAAAAVTDTALKALPTDDAEPAYELWRRRIQEQFRELE